MHKRALIAIAVLAAGCTMAPKYHRPAVPTSATFPAGGVYDMAPQADAAHSAKGAAAADIGWRDFFTDPRLQQVISIALKNNRDLRVAVLNVEAMRAQYRITSAPLFPALAGEGGMNAAGMPEDLSPTDQTVSRSYSAGIGVSWELDFWGRIRSLKNQALAQYLATAEARRAAEISLIAQVANQYLIMLSVDDLLAVTRDTLKTAQDSYQLTKLQFNNGVGSELALRQAQSVVEQAQANMQAQARARAQAENALALLIGESLPADLPAGLPLDGQSVFADIPAGLPSDLLMRRPDIMAAENALLAANANIGAARAAFFPRVALTGDAGSASSTLGGLFKPGSFAWSFVPEITLPIFQGGSNQANLNLAYVQKRIQIAQYEKAIQSAFRDVADGLAARGTFDVQIAALERNVVAQQRVLDLADLRYRNGVDSYLQVLTAQTNLYAARQALISARVGRLANLVNLYAALGGGWIERAGDIPRPADAPMN